MPRATLVGAVGEKGARKLSNYHEMFLAKGEACPPTRGRITKCSKVVASDASYVSVLAPGDDLLIRSSVCECELELEEAS